MRPPPGFVSYQVPNGSLIPSDNINLYDPKKYSSAHVLGRNQHNGSSRNTREYNYSSEQNSILTRDPSIDHRTHAGVYPSHLHNVGRSHRTYQNNGHNMSAVSEQLQHRESLYTSSSNYNDYNYSQGRLNQNDYEPPPWMRISEPKKYPRSPAPKQRVADIDEETDRPFESHHLKPPLPPVDQPKPPPRSRPKSWTSTLFNAFKSNNKNTPNLTMPASSVTIVNQSQQVPYTSSFNGSQTVAPVLSDPLDFLPSYTNTLDRKQQGSKQVRFLANPSKNIETNPKFYSLPRFIQPVVADKGEMVKTVKTKIRSRTPSPFNRFVKSLVRGKGISTFALQGQKTLTISCWMLFYVRLLMICLHSSCLGARLILLVGEYRMLQFLIFTIFTLTRFNGGLKKQLMTGRTEQKNKQIFVNKCFSVTFPFSIYVVRMLVDEINF